MRRSPPTYGMGVTILNLLSTVEGCHENQISKCKALWRRDINIVILFIGGSTNHHNRTLIITRILQEPAMVVVLVRHF